ncbi:probable polygalacturonase At3g15720 [Olea europaea subsp. europaea]|uniref:Probable polygalacturonase At3g15720 n=1 Tax=Olea europaea subsp. europaea TaxID=158383 RepID=A0A8S0SBF7_OLEEU|nr:probable polygalacturonase At3g15720 [Olea europaea subsp. europaea]
MQTTPLLSKATMRCCGGGNFGNGGIDTVVLMEVVRCDDFIICGSLALVVATATLLRCLLLAVVAVVGDVVVRCWLCCGGGFVCVGSGGGGSGSIVVFAISCGYGSVGCGGFVALALVVVAVTLLRCLLLVMVAVALAMGVVWCDVGVVVGCRGNAFVLLVCVISHSHTAFNVLNYGAVGSGRTDDTYINGNIIAPSEPSEWRCENNDCHNWMDFRHVDNLSIRGNGVITGDGYKWWHTSEALKISSANNVTLSGLTFKDIPHMHVILDSLTSVHVLNITIDSPGDSPNTDGIHITGSTNVVVDHCRIGTGDDCISIVSGTSNVKISNIVCGPGHGISVGSLGKNGNHDIVENVEVSNVVFIRTMNGARIKTWQGGSGFARNMVFEKILSHESSRIIDIDQFYCDHMHCETQESALTVSNITFRQIIGTSSKHTAVNLECSSSVPCTDIVLDDIYIVQNDKQRASVACNNAYGRVQGMNVPDIPCLNQI